MPVIDFTEVPKATSGAGRDRFELFAREFLELLGYKIISGPDRGADAGRDLVVEETRTGVGGQTHVKWLVSCKHKAHSGTAVTPTDETDIHDRVRTHGCSGFLGFYSTILSAGLSSKLMASTLPFEVQIYDPERIEKYLLSSSAGLQLAQRFFPKSIGTWEKEHPTPAKIFQEETDLQCKYCGQSLLIPEPQGMVVIWTTLRHEDHQAQEYTQDLYWCCKGHCDEALARGYRRKGLTDGWEDIPDLLIPTVYIRCIMATLNRLYHGNTYSSEAFENYKELLLQLFPHVSRHLTREETERVKSLAMIPHYLGALGYDRPER